MQVYAGIDIYHFRPMSNPSWGFCCCLPQSVEGGVKSYRTSAANMWDWIRPSGMLRNLEEKICRVYFSQLNLSNGFKIDLEGKNVDLLQ